MEEKKLIVVKDGKVSVCDSLTEASNILAVTYKRVRHVVMKENGKSRFYSIFPYNADLYRELEHKYNENGNL